MFRQSLTFVGVDSQEAADGFDALRLLDSSGPFDAVVLDLGLPVVSGYVVRQEIASHAHLRRIPVIVVTGLPGEHSELDAACILHKPVDPEHLIRTIRRCIAAGSSSAQSC